MSLFEIKEMRELHIINGQLECGMREEVKHHLPNELSHPGGNGHSGAKRVDYFFLVIRSKR